MTRIDATRSDNIDTSIRRLKRLNDKVGHSIRLRNLQHYIKPKTARRNAAISARKRHLKNLQKEKIMLARVKQRIQLKKKTRIK